MSTTLYIAIGLIVIAIITYIVVSLVYGKASILDLAPKQLQLNKKNSVYDSDSVKTQLMSNGGSSVMAFVNVHLGDRTVKVEDSFIPLLGVTGSFEFNVSPTASRLTVYTMTGTTAKMEYIDVPKLPFQKWIFISILRDGRRFDVMYNDQIVASHRLEYFPSIISNSLTIGNSRLIGSTVNVLVAPYRLTPSAVALQRSKLSDTTGQPIAARAGAIGLPPIPFTGIRSLCIPGLPCDPITKPPPNHLKAWSTPFS